MYEITDRRGTEPAPVVAFVDWFENYVEVQQMLAGRQPRFIFG
jgi:hypothetical protein